MVSSSVLASLCGFVDSRCFTVLILFGLLRPLVASISGIPSASIVCLPISGGESIFPLMTIMVVRTVRVSFHISTYAAPSTGNSSLSALSLILVSLSFISGACFCNFLNWLSSMMLLFDPLSGSAWISTPFI